MPVHLSAPGHGEVAIEIEGAVRRAEAVGNRPDHHRGVEDVVVEGEVIGRYEVDTGGGQLLPVVLPDLGRGALQFFSRDGSGPVRLEGPFE
jgi:hypothetical protein